MQKLTILKFTVFQSTENIEIFFGGITMLSQCRKYCEVTYNFLTVLKKLWRESQFCSTVPKILWRESQLCPSVKIFLN